MSNKIKKPIKQARMKTNEWTLIEHHKHHNNNFNDGLAKSIYELFKPNTILEFGCGVGYYCNYWSNCEGVETVHGIEPNEMDQKMFNNTNCKQLTFNLINDDESQFEFLDKYDLVVSIEVAEHIDRKYHDRLFDFLTKKSKNIIVFSGARLNQPGHGHIACRSEEDWRSEFIKRNKTWDIINTNLLRNKSNKRNINHRKNIQVFKNIMDTEEAIRYCNENCIDGDYVECGVFWGRHPIKACNTIIKNKFLKINIYMFDTFEGLTKPGKYDYACPGVNNLNNKQIMEKWGKNKHLSNKTSDWCYSSLNDVKNNVYKTNYPKNKLHFIKGDVMDTLEQEKNIPNKICILRLDTDWYESSKFELQKLYEKVVEGGVIILDDYFLWDGQRRATDEFLKENNIERNIIRNNHKCGYFIK